MHFQSASLVRCFCFAPFNVLSSSVGKCIVITDGDHGIGYAYLHQCCRLSYLDHKAHRSRASTNAEEFMEKVGSIKAKVWICAFFRPPQLTERNWAYKRDVTDRVHLVHKLINKDTGPLARLIGLLQTRQEGHHLCLQRSECSPISFRDLDGIIKTPIWY